MGGEIMGKQKAKREKPVTLTSNRFAKHKKPPGAADHGGTGGDLAASAAVSVFSVVSVAAVSFVDPPQAIKLNVIAAAHVSARIFFIFIFSFLLIFYHIFR